MNKGNMEDLFHNKKELYIGKRIFTCDFNVVRNLEKREDLTENQKKLLNVDKEETEESVEQANHKVNKKDKKTTEKHSKDREQEEQTEDEKTEEEQECVDRNLKMYLFNQDVYIKIGTIEYIGNLKNTNEEKNPTENKIFYGVEWDSEYNGKNFGNYKDDIYFVPKIFLKKRKAKEEWRIKKEEANKNTKEDNILNNTKMIEPVVNKECAKEEINNSDLMDQYKDFIKKENRMVTPCSFLTLHNTYVGITFVQALQFRYNYFPELNMNIEDYQTKKIKPVIFSGEMKVMKHFKNYVNLENITLNKYLIYECGIIDNLRFHNLRSLSLSCNLLSNWNEVFKIIQLTKNLSYLNLSNNRFTPIDVHTIFKESKNQKDLRNEKKDCSKEPMYFCSIKELCLDNTLIEWRDVVILSFLFPNLEILSLKKNYLTSINIKNIKTDSTQNDIIYKYIHHSKYREMVDSNETKEEPNEPKELKNPSMQTDKTEKNPMESVQLFRKLKKIVLNDNYLYDYEELFYFIYKTNSIRSLFINNNKYSDNEQLIEIAYNVCTREGMQNKKEEVEKENQFETINQHFSRLKELLFDNNKLTQYATLRDLFYIFYDLEVLKLQNTKNYSKEKKDLRCIFISILPKLKVLNHSSISKNERIHSERFFISLYQKDKIAMIFNEIVMNRRHSEVLEKIHYKANEHHLHMEATKSMQSNLITITIIPEFLSSKQNNIIKKKVNKFMNIKDLRYLCSRLYSVPLPKLKLYYTHENSPIYIEILDSNANLYTYGIENNSKIKIKLDE